MIVNPCGCRVATTYWAVRRASYSENGAQCDCGIRPSRCFLIYEERISAGLLLPCQAVAVVDILHAISAASFRHTKCGSGPAPAQEVSLSLPSTVRRACLPAFSNTCLRKKVVVQFNVRQGIQLVARDISVFQLAYTPERHKNA